MNQTLHLLDSARTKNAACSDVIVAVRLAATASGLRVNSLPYFCTSDWTSASTAALMGARFTSKTMHRMRKIIVKATCK